MPDYNNLCLNCMHPISNSQEQCPNCGFDNNTLQQSPYLPYRTIIGKRYLIGSVLEHNGEGITYNGYDIELKVPVTIREFMPDKIATRNTGETNVNVITGKESIYDECLQSFFDLWRRLARMRGLSSLIVVIDIVEDNSTAYAISEHIDGCTLREYLLSTECGYISWQDARSMFMPVLSTLSTLHSAGIIHRGISPTTLIVGKDKKIRICGFCIWQARASYGEINSELFPGYAAIEQYGFDGQQGPWTDIYALSAVLYRTLIGSTPIEANTRVTNDKMMIPGKFAEQLPAYVINGMINALQILPEDRTRTFDQFKAELSAAPSVTIADVHFKNEIENEMKSNARKQKNKHKDNKAQPSKQKKKKTSKSVPTNTINIDDSIKKKKKHKVHPAVITAIVLSIVLLIVIVVLIFTVIKKNLNADKSNVLSSTTSENQANKCTVPDFADKSYDRVRSTSLYTKDFTFFKKEEYSDTVQAGYIISQSVDAGESVPIGTEITLVVSKGTSKIRFPEIINMTSESASEQLTKLGFVVDKREKYNDGMKAPGTVAGYNLQPNQLYPKGTTAIIQVWSDFDNNRTTEENTQENTQENN